MVCSYTRNGNIYASISEDGGITWEEFPVLNDIDGSVVEQENGIDISGSNVVWTDNQNANTAIHFGKAQVAIPVIEIDSVSGGFGVNAIIKNTGNAEATNIDWSIILDGGAFIGGETTGTITSLSPGQSANIKSDLIIGLGRTEITITVGNAKETASGTILLFFIIGL